MFATGGLLFWGLAPCYGNIYFRIADGAALCSGQCGVIMTTERTIATWDAAPVRAGRAGNLDDLLARSDGAGAGCARFVIEVRTPCCCGFVVQKMRRQAITQSTWVVSIIGSCTCWG